MEELLTTVGTGGAMRRGNDSPGVADCYEAYEWTEMLSSGSHGGGPATPPLPAYDRSLTLRSSRPAGHAGTVVGILAPGPSAKPFTASSDSTDAMAVDDTPSSSTPSSSFEPKEKEKEKSEATRKKEEEARVEREKKYPLPHKAGIVLAAEKKVTSKLLEKEKGSSEKLFLINGCATHSFPTTLATRY